MRDEGGKTLNSKRTKNEARNGWQNRNPHQQQIKFLIREFYEYLWRQNIFNQKPVISRWNIQMEADFFASYYFSALQMNRKVTQS